MNFELRIIRDFRLEPQLSDSDFLVFDVPQHFKFVNTFCSLEGDTEPEPIDAEKWEALGKLLTKL